MRRWLLMGAVAITLACVGMGCESDSGSDADTHADTLCDASGTDTSAEDTVVPVDSHREDVPTGEFGFAIRTPREYTLPCDDSIAGHPESITELDADWLCTYAWGGIEGHIYVQATPTSCESMGMSVQPAYRMDGAWMSVAGAVTELSGPYYDIGGNHLNDWLEFEYGEHHFKYYHSSFSPGWRKCLPMDCVQVTTADGAMVEDGCTPDRTLPAVCVRIAADGTHAPLEDTFEPCEGDENFK